MKNINNKIIYDYHEELESDKWAKEIPYLKFNSDWEVKIVPGVGGAIIRFSVTYKGNHVSTYLDCYDMLGLGVGFEKQQIPYWEVYDSNSGDCFRFHMNDTDKLLAKIENILD